MHSQAAGTADRFCERLSCHLGGPVEEEKKEGRGGKEAGAAVAYNYSQSSWGFMISKILSEKSQIH